MQRLETLNNGRVKQLIGLDVDFRQPDLEIDNFKLKRTALAPAGEGELVMAWKRPALPGLPMPPGLRIRVRSLSALLMSDAAQTVSLAARSAPDFSSACPRTAPARLILGGAGDSSENAAP